MKKQATYAAGMWNKRPWLILRYYIDNCMEVARNQTKVRPWPGFYRDPPNSEPDAPWLCQPDRRMGWNTDPIINQLSHPTKPQLHYWLIILRRPCQLMRSDLVESTTEERGMKGACDLSRFSSFNASTVLLAAFLFLFRQKQHGYHIALLKLPFTGTQWTRLKSRTVMWN
jgi:hypothetical protein